MLSLLSWLTQVASSGSEEEWLALAREENQKAIALHVKHARDTKSDRPRRGGFGLPGQPGPMLRRDLLLPGKHRHCAARERTQCCEATGE